MKKIFFILGLLVSLNQVIAQPKGKVTYEAKMMAAEEAADTYDYQNAIDIYSEAYKETRDLDLLVYSGDLAMLLRHYETAERRYDQLLRKDKNNNYGDLRLDYAKALKYQGKYREARTELNKFLETATSDTLIGIAKRELEGINLMSVYPENIEAVVTFESPEINSSSAESSPAPYADGSLYFASFNQKRAIVLDGDEGDIDAKIYVAKRDKEGVYKDINPLDDVINRKGFNTGGVSFSRDGNKMYFTRAKLDNNELASSKIYESIKTGTEWGPAHEIAAVNGDFISKHPFEGELYGRKVLFFSSDMAGGHGKFDLYYSTINGNEYSQPINLGTSINTAGNEISPYYKDGTLYFSTDGLPGMGGYDIFYAVWNGREFEGLSNMGFNYNSSADDMFLRFDETGRRGYLVSNRPDKDKKKMKSIYCCDDIYSLVLRDLVIDLNTLVYDNDNNDEIIGATVELMDKTAGKSDNKTGVASNKIQFLLDSDRKYQAIVSHPDYYSDTITFNTLGIIDDYSIKKSIKLKSKPKEPATEIVTINQPIRLNNIYYDFDDAKILPDAERDLSTLYDLMKEYPDMVIELSSHTDSRGESPYNKKLSQRRADSAKKWLVNEGVDANRIQAVGYGESVILNQCKNGVRCSEEEHRLNRRTEFKIIAGPKTIEIKREIFKGVTPVDEDYQGSKNAFGLKPKPVISFENNMQDLGVIKRGAKVPFEFKFVNSGDADLLIELVSSCKCTEVVWPTDPVKPGESGIITATYDTTFQQAGETEKIIDIIANTDPIVVEARFKAVIIE
ncbi:MAG: DUF1573 domain-containing protein [Lewinellaceae bacterium]|nr:DUF1573 domain-containing protein [Lewinellaceae bacterium]